MSLKRYEAVFQCHGNMRKTIYARNDDSAERKAQRWVNKEVTGESDLIAFVTCVGDVECTDGFIGNYEEEKNV